MAKPLLEADALAACLDQWFPKRSPLRQLAEGEESRAFDFEAEGEPLVVRVNRSAAGFEMDRLAFEALDGSGIPVPEVLAIGPLDGSGHVCVSRRLPGVTLQSLPPGGAYAYGRTVGETLDALAALDPERLRGFGADNWAGFVQAMAGLDWSIVRSAVEGDQIARHIDRIEGIVPRLPRQRGLVHGDFGSNNVLVAGGQVSGVLDWSEARIGDPLYDRANILFWRPWLDCMEQQCRYFEENEPDRLAANRDSLVCYQLRIGLGTLHEALGNGDGGLADWALERCAAISGEAQSISRSD